MTTLNGVCPYNENSYAILYSFVEGARPEISFFGSINVYSKKGDVCITLKELLYKIQTLVKEHPAFNEQERQLGEKISDKFSNLCDDFRKLEDEANIITLIIMFILNIPYALDGDPFVNLDGQCPTFYKENCKYNYFIP